GCGRGKGGARVAEVRRGKGALAFPGCRPGPGLRGLTAAAEAARDTGDVEALEELALRLAGSVVAALADGKTAARPPRRRDERRISEALRRIEADADAPHGLAELARDAAMSRYPFLP